MKPSAHANVCMLTWSPADGATALLGRHPRLATRTFVLRPLADIRPDLVMPGQTDSVSKLLAAIPHADAVRMVAPTW
ncbi:MAG: hypothetical protein IAE82_17290 [Opitutaceae bacterium]|nr:hypothetical protein [Opitutaceae bacterium]